MYADEILQEIEEKKYLCLVCHTEIGPESPIWTCSNCFRSFDLPCAKEWSRKDNSRPGGWRCPHCLKGQGSRKPQHRCWCSKVKDPEPLLGRPHSCGQTCGAKIGCPHPCTMVCHPGPHNPCVSIGPPIKCWCGKSQVHTFCSETPYKGFSCGNQCGNKKKCGHTCRRKCHKGGCGACHVKVRTRCWCGDSSKNIECSKLSANGGSFSCDKTCTAVLDCGKCICGKKCHPESSHVCANKPTENERCPCGRHLVSELLGRNRISCEEEVPTCQSTCKRTLSCGHYCQAKCHKGPCPPCLTTRSEPCTCGSTVQHANCGEPVPQCHTKCGALLSCGHHRCHRECCLFRPSHHGKSKIITDLNDLSLQRSPEELAFHSCPRSCHRLLGCGIHRCRKNCHEGPCGPCLRSTSEDYVCACGRTRLLAPIRCGTELPECPFDCSRKRKCGHPAGHPCHDDGECPPCKYPVPSKCVCGKSTIKRACCSISSEENTPPRCGTVCGNVIPCGHRCQEVCHKGPCPTNCSQVCGRKLDSCGHNCEISCHPGKECPPCSKKLIAHCPCRRLVSPFECGENLEIFCTPECYNREPQYPEVVISAYRDSPNWTLALEKEIRQFVFSGGKTHWFRPMRRSRRKIVHYFIESFGLEGESMDEGAARSVCAYRTPNTWLPKVTLRRSLELRKIHGIHLEEHVSETEAPEEISKEGKNRSEPNSEPDADGWQVAHGPNSSNSVTAPATSPVHDTSKYSLLLSES